MTRRPTSEPRRTGKGIPNRKRNPRSSPSKGRPTKGLSRKGWAARRGCLLPEETQESLWYVVGKQDLELPWGFSWAPQSYLSFGIGERHQGGGNPPSSPPASAYLPLPKKEKAFLPLHRGALDMSGFRLSVFFVFPCVHGSHKNTKPGGLLLLLGRFFLTVKRSYRRTSKLLCGGLNRTSDLGRIPGILFR